MKNPFIALTAVLALAVPVLAHAWAGLGDAGAGMTVDYNPGVLISAVPQTITAGESTFISFSAPLASDNVTSSPQPNVGRNCTTNFSYNEVPAPGATTGSYWGTMGTATDYPTATKTYTATCRLFQSESASGVTYRYETGSVTVTVTPAQAIDLTAGAVSPTGVTGGYTTTLSSTISNVGVGATTGGFTSLFQMATDASGTGAQDIGTFARSTALGASSGFTATLSYTFPSVTSPTTLYIRACADKSSAANTGSVTESNETNNCSPWEAITISPSGAQCSDTVDNDNDGLTDTADTGDCTGPSDPTEGVQVTANLTANPTAIALGESSTLSWSSAGATSCTGTGFTTGGATSGSVSVSPVTTSPYQVSCTGASGTAVDIETITVGTATADISVAPERVAAGSSATVTWTSTGAAACAVSGPGLSSAAVSGSQSVTVTKQQTYTISCGNATDSATVNVIPRFEEF